MSVFAERLKELRKEKGLTQQKVADSLNISQPNYRRWESGERLPSVETLVMLADYFEVSIDYLLTRKNQKVFENEKIYTEEDLIIILQDFEKFILPFSFNIVHSSVSKYLNYRKNQRN